MMVDMTQSTPPTEALAAVITSLREARGLSQSKLARAAQITEPTFRNRMQGVPPGFTLRELFAIAAELGTTADDLLARAQNSTEPSAA